MKKENLHLFIFFLSSVLRRKFWILIIGSLLATLPFSVVVAIIVQSKLQTFLLLRRWILYIYNPIVTLLFPLVTSMMVFLDLITEQTMKDLVVLPISRKKLFSIGFIIHILLNLLLGLFIGWILYFFTNSIAVLFFSKFYVPIDIILSISAVLLFFAIIYGGLCLILAFLFEQKGSDVFLLLFFLLTFIWDLIFWSIGDSYALVSYSYYKLSLFHLFLTKSLLKLQVKTLIPIKSTVLQTIVVIIGMCMLMFYLAIRLFVKKEY